MPISDPKPVHSIQKNVSQLQTPPKNVTTTVPRSQPISMKRSGNRSSNCDISSISPPAVQFAIGTPPGGGRRRSTSGGSLSETPPPPCTWQVSPGAHQSPLRRSGTTSPVLSSVLSKMPAFECPTILAENNNSHVPPLGRAFTLPEIGATSGLHNLINDTNVMQDHPITFHAPELPAETLLDVSRKYFLLCLIRFRLFKTLFYFLYNICFILYMLYLAAYFCMNEFIFNNY